MSNKIISAVLAAALFAGCGGDGPLEVDPDPAPPDTLPRLEGTWTQGPGLPSVQHSFAVAVHDGAIYAVGGGRGFVDTDELTQRTVNRLSLEDGATWEVLPDYPIDAIDIAVASVRDTLFGVGGLGFPSRRWERLFLFDADSDDWDLAGEPTEPVGRLQAVVTGGKAVVVGTDFENFGRVWQAEGPLGPWTEGRRMPSNRQGFDVTAGGGRVYTVFGGPSEASPKIGSGLVEAYDPSADAWSEVTQAPVALDLVGAAFLEGRIHVLGGFGQERESTTTHLVYDLAAERWYRGPDLPMPRRAPEVVAADGAIWVLGGWNEGESPPLRREVWVFRPDS